MECLAGGPIPQTPLQNRKEALICTIPQAVFATMKACNEVNHNLHAK